VNVPYIESDMLDRSDGADAALTVQLMRVARISALEEMASGFAHELNQPLGAIATFAAAGRLMLAQEGGAARLGNVLTQIRDEAMKAADGIRRIRKLFVVDGARGLCSVADLIDELRPVIDIALGNAGVALDEDYQRDLPLVRVDRLRVQHVLLALIENALDATRSRGGNVIRIEANADRYGVEVAVTDQGSGIAAEHRAEVFRPFFTTKAGGTGLGLATSRATIESHEGSIGFDTAEAGGTRFWFRLPIAETA
jgi:C4-dicarboxylate-specific signal transduction histidine kinase